MKLAFNIAKRYLFAKKSTNAINIISLISAVGMCFGTMALILVLSVFNGFEGLVVSLYDTFNPDLKVEPAEGKVFVPLPLQMDHINSIDGIENVSMVLEDFALLKYDKKYEQCRIKAVDDSFEQTSAIADTAMIRGKFKLKDDNVLNAVVGYGIERNLDIDIYNDFERLDILMPKRTGKVSLNPENAFNKKSIRIAGTFSIQEEFDREYVFVPLELMQEMLAYQNGEISQLEISLKPGANVNNIQRELAGVLGNGFKIENRYQQDEQLYKVMKTEKLVVFLILSLILIVASFNIVGSLSMLVIEKTKDIAILKSMGADKSLIRRIFLFEGFLLSFLGGLLGMILAFFICFFQQRFKFITLQGDSLLIDAYPVQMEWPDFALTLLTVVLITIAASYLPAQRAANQDEMLRNVE